MTTLAAPVTAHVSSLRFAFSAAELAALEADVDEVQGAYDRAVGVEHGTDLDQRLARVAAAQALVDDATPYINQAGTFRVGQSVLPELLDRTALPFAPMLASLATVAPDVIDGTAAPFAPALDSTAHLSMPLLGQVASVMTPAVTYDQFVLPALLAQLAVVFAPRVTVPGSGHAFSQVLILGPHV